MSSTNLTAPILEKVQQLSYSDDSIYEFFNLANKAYLVVYSQGVDGKKEHLDNIKKVIEQQIRPLLEEELTKGEKLAMFNTAKTNFEKHLEAFAKKAK